MARSPIDVTAPVRGDRSRVNTLGMRLGYACVNTQLPSSARTLRLANATPERLRELIAANLDALEAILRWNEANDIRVFRLTSNLVPFGSHPANTLAWWDEFAGRFEELGAQLRTTRARVSTHPGQYTVLSSEQPHVVEAAIAELDYHDRLLAALGLDRSHKIVLHVGSGAGDPAAARARFAPRIRAPLRRERVRGSSSRTTSAGRSSACSSSPARSICPSCSTPSITGSHPRSKRSACARPSSSSPRRGGPSTADRRCISPRRQPGKRPGAHAQTLDLDAFALFVDEVGDLPLDCILEVKDKELSVLRARELLHAAV